MYISILLIGFMFIYRLILFQFVRLILIYFVNNGIQFLK